MHKTTKGLSQEGEKCKPSRGSYLYNANNSQREDGFEIALYHPSDVA